jgi:hypothetical protein
MWRHVDVAALRRMVRAGDTLQILSFTRGGGLPAVWQVSRGSDVLLPYADKVDQVRRGRTIARTIAIVMVLVGLVVATRDWQLQLKTG